LCNNRKREDHTVSGEQGIEGLREDVDDRGRVLSSPVETGELLQDQGGVAQVRHSLGAKQLTNNAYIVQCDCHSATGERVTHIQGIAQDHHAWRLIG
jgi:hypothetical protein